MRLKLFHKIFLVNLLIVVLLTSISLLLNYYSNTSLLSRAMNGIDEKVMESLAEILGDHYQEQRSWTTLINSKELWSKTVDTEFFKVFFAVASKKQPVIQPVPSAPQDIPALEPCDPPFATFLQRLSLLDSNKEPLIRAEVWVADANFHKIRLDGKLVGWLRVGKINADVIPLSEHFFNQQLKLGIWASIFAGLFTLIISYWLSRQFTFPLKKLALQ